MLRRPIEYYLTPTPSIDGYATASIEERLARLKLAHFKRTWYLRTGANAGWGTRHPPFSADPSKRVLTGFLPKQEFNDVILVRNAHVTPTGRLCDKTAKLAAQLTLPHNATETVEDKEERELSAVRNSALFMHAQHALCECSQCMYRLSK